MNAPSIHVLRTRTIILSITLASALAACDSGAPAAQTVTAASTPSSDPPAAQMAAKKPCDYIARADAEASVGQPLPNTSEQIPLGMCDYNTPEFYGASLTVGDWESIKNAATSGAHQPVSVSGVGDEALNLNGSNGSNLYVRKGDRGFLLTLNGPNIDHLADHGLDKEKTLALKILPNL